MLYAILGMSKLTLPRSYRYEIGVGKDREIKEFFVSLQVEIWQVNLNTIYI